jgi:hypothetical protein
MTHRRCAAATQYDRKLSSHHAAPLLVTATFPIDAEQWSLPLGQADEQSSAAGRRNVKAPVNNFSVIRPLIFIGRCRHSFRRAFSQVEDLAPMILLALAAASATPATDQFIADSLLRVQVLAERPLPRERAVGPGRPIYAQEITRDGYLEFLDRDEEKAVRRKYDMDMSDFFSLTEWVGVSAQDAGLQHRGWLYCVRRSRFGTEKCLQDSDADGKLDRLTNSDPDQPTRFLTFQPIPPIAYRYVPRQRKDSGEAVYRQPEVSLFYTIVDGRMRFGANAYIGPLSSVDLGALATVDTAMLPATVQLAGARVRVISWDGKRATLAVDTPMTASALRLIAPEDRPVLIGGGRGWRLEFVNAALPGR